MSTELLSKENILISGKLTKRIRTFGPKTIEHIYSAMDEYAKQEAIGFAEWISNHKLDFQTASNGRWIGLDMKTLTAEQLYELYMLSKK